MNYCHYNMETNGVSSYTVHTLIRLGCRMFVWLFLFPLFGYLFVCLPVCQHVSLLNDFSGYLSILSRYLSGHLSVCPNVCHFVYLWFHSFILMSIFFCFYQIFCLFLSSSSLCSACFRPLSFLPIFRSLTFLSVFRLLNFFTVYFSGHLIFGLFFSVTQFFVYFFVT